MVFYTESCRPSITYFEFILFKMRMRNNDSTLQKKAHAISRFFNYVNQEFNSNVDNLILEKNDPVLNQCIKSYKLFITNSITSKSNYKNLLLSTLSEYLTYVNENFNLGISIDTLNIKGFMSKPSLTKKLRNVTKDHIDMILELSHPESSYNPFSYDENLRIRNYLILRVLYETGIRIGELMCLTVNSYYSSNSRFYIRIEKDKSQDDPRHAKGSIKNDFSIREISLSEETHFLLHHYVTRIRRTYLKIDSSSISPTQFLFISKHGKPISDDSIRDIIDKVNSQVNLLLNTSFETKPHDFRYAFANKFLDYLITHQGVDMELAKDNLRNIMGWAPNSPMPAKYAANFISDQANQSNIHRINTQYDD